ncbi:MAG: radical SAM protein [Candidatus Binatia bacterium]
MRRVDELCDEFPDVPRAVVIKTDVLREGVKFTPVALKIGRWAIPEFLPWDREVHKDYSAIENNLVSENWAWLPHSMTFPEGITAKVVYDFVRHHTSPYEIRQHDDGSLWLFSEEEPLTELRFEKRPEWLSRRLENGRPMASIFVLSSPDRLLGFPIRFCAHYRPEDICRFCCLNPVGKNIAKGDGYHDVIMSGEAAARSFSAALEETGIRHITLTGGTVRDQSKEAGIYADVVQRLSRVRYETRANVAVQVMSTALDDDGQERLQEAGVDEVCFNMEVWEARLWPQIVPGKHRHVGRTAWMQRLCRAVERFGRGRVLCQFVVGVEMVSGGFATYAEAIDSVVTGLEWCAHNGIQPRTHIWCNTPGSLYEPGKVPPTEYFLTVAREHHRLLEKYGMYFPREARPPYSVACHRCGYLSPDADFQWLLRADKPAAYTREQAG